KLLDRGLTPGGFELNLTLMPSSFFPLPSSFFLLPSSFFLTYDGKYNQTDTVCLHVQSDRSPYISKSKHSAV
ncbi:hypothetical protein, partial [Kamptonema sp. PCC 6506]|uniref:hypothetical protein n=1 Tax=Kamptonema sp. PCC 6506 TaxID=272129 RepID=UPI001F29B30C